MLGEGVLGLLFLFFCCSEGLRVLKVEVPRYVILGDSANLKCHFSLEGEKLYSLKWWKDDRQFYQFIPRNEPKMVVFEVPGVVVNRKRSGMHVVELIEVQDSSQGQYKCEVVAEAPTFNTHILDSNMSVIDPPDGPPVVRGQKPIYHPGEIINLNCTSYRSRPLPQLQWEIMNYEPIAKSSSSSLLPSKTSESSKPVKPSHHSSYFSEDASSSSFSVSSSNLALASSLKAHPHKKKHQRPFISSLWSFSLTQFNSNSLDKVEFHPNKNLEAFSKRNRKHRTATLPEVSSSVFKASNYTVVNPRHLLTYPAQSSGEKNLVVYSLTLGIQYPATVKEAPKGEISFRCSSLIHNFRWATEVKVAIAEVPVADPQQLPTLHGTGAPRGSGSRHYPSLILAILIISLIRR